MSTGTSTMRQSFTLAIAALASTTTAQATSSLTFWLPGPANNPSYASRHGLGTTTFPPVASIVSSDTATTIFALGCPTTGPSSILNGDYYETCSWATDYGTYSIISSTKYVLHRSQDRPSASMWWTCDHDVQATKVTCDMEVSGDVNDNTDGPISGVVFGAEPDRAGNVIALATAEVVTEGRFGEFECNRGYGQESVSITCDSNGSGGTGTKVWSVSSEGSATATASEPSLTASEGSRSGTGTTAAATAASTASESAATESAGAAGGFGVDAVKLAALVGGAAVAAW